MFNNTQQRAELLEGLIISNKEAAITTFSQQIDLLWGENDQIFKTELPQNMIVELGENATFESIKDAGHLVHLERPFVYNSCLNKFLASIHTN